MEKLNLELIYKCLESRKKELLDLRKSYEYDLSCCNKRYNPFNYEFIVDTLSSIQDELIDIAEEEQKIEAIKAQKFKELVTKKEND